MINLAALQERIAVLPTDDAETPVTRRWLEEVLQSLSASSAMAANDQAIGKICADLQGKAA